MPKCWSCKENVLEITIRKGTLSDLETYMAFTHDIQDAMAQKDWFAVDPDEETRELAEVGDLEFWLAEAQGRLAGVFSIVHPRLRDFNLGRETGLTDMELLRVTHMDTAAVHPDFRGLGLQRRLLQEAEGELQGRILLCTIHPDNQYSLKNALNLGYQIQKKVARYSSIRYILQKNP